MKIVLNIIVLFALGLNQAVANISEQQLENGLKVIVIEDHRAPVVVSQVWYNIGSSYEHDGISGVSHVLEHMMFKGTKDLKPGEFSKIIARNGGRENAFTSKDYTAYFQRISNDRLELCLKLEADRMRNVVFLQHEFDKEVEVVKEERRLRVENRPKSKLYEQFYATAFLTNPIRIPVIGWMEDLDSLKMEDAAEWYKKWYAPNNATLVVVGDVKPDEVFKLAEQYFGPLKPSDITAPKPRKEIKQTGLKRFTMYGQTASPYLMMGYKMPVLNTIEDEKEAFALDVLGGILDGGNSARISKNLIRGKELAVSAGIGYDLYDREQGIFILVGTPSKQSSVEKLEQAFYQELDELKTNLVSEQELARVKAQTVAQKVYDRDSMFNMGMQVGMLVTTGYDRQEIDRYVEQIKLVTAEQIRQVAKKYFNSETLTIATLLPEKSAE